MRCVIQRVTQASVTVDGEITGQIEKGFMVLLGVVEGDTDEEMRLLARKVGEIRIFTDENGKMNLSLSQVGGAVLLVSQFTLCADLAKGRRPSFTLSAKPSEAERLYLAFGKELEKYGVTDVQYGVFGADMAVRLCNDGPVTIVMDTDTWKRG